MYSLHPLSPSMTLSRPGGRVLPYFTVYGGDCCDHTMLVDPHSTTLKAFQVNFNHMQG